MPYIKKADLATIQESYQYLMKKFVIIPREKRRRIKKMRNVSAFVTISKDNEDDLEAHEDLETDPEMIESARILAELQEEEKSLRRKSQDHDLEEVQHFSQQLSELISQEFADLNLENQQLLPNTKKESTIGPLENFQLSRNGSAKHSSTSSAKHSRRGSKKFEVDHGSRRGSRRGSREPDEIGKIFYLERTP